MPKEIEPKSEPKTEPKSEPKTEPKAEPKEEIKVQPVGEPLKIMGEPKLFEPKEDTVTLKSFTELKAAFESLENKINEFIPKQPISTPPEPKQYRLFDEFEVL